MKNKKLKKEKIKIYQEPKRRHIVTFGLIMGMLFTILGLILKNFTNNHSQFIYWVGFIIVILTSIFNIVTEVIGNRRR